LAIFDCMMMFIVQITVFKKKVEEKTITTFIVRPSNLMPRIFTNVKMARVVKTMKQKRLTPKIILPTLFLSIYISLC
jgi:hypothetical protein